jgi:divalent metal cation (Fe/Co/Zn/Cd) transporter
LPIPLLERSPEETGARVRGIIDATKHVRGCGEVNVRMVGKRIDIIAHVLLDSGLKFEDIHRILSEIEWKVKRSIHRVTRISVHTNPVGRGYENIDKLVEEIVERVPGCRGVHGIHIQQVTDKLCFDLDLEVAANMPLNQAHATANEVKKRLRAAYQNVSGITVHMESASDIVSSELEGRSAELKRSEEHAKGIMTAFENQ